MNIPKIKLISSILITSEILLISIFSLKIKQKILTSKKAISFLNCFIAGLFISLSLINILPEANKNLEKYFFVEKNKFPLGFFLCLFGYCVFFVFDKYFFFDLNFKKKNEFFEIEMVKNKKNDNLKIEENLENKSMFDFTNKKINILNLKDKNFSLSKKNQKKKSLENPIIPKINLQTKTKKKLNFSTEKKKMFFCEKENKFRYYSIITIIIFHGILQGLNLGIKIHQKNPYKILLKILFTNWAEIFILSIFLLKKKISIFFFFYVIFFYSFFVNFAIFFGISFFKLAKFFCFFKCLISGVFFYLSCGVLTLSEFSNNRDCVFKFIFYCFGIGFVLIVRYFQ